jgi:exonuclease VII large subunit
MGAVMSLRKERIAYLAQEDQRCAELSDRLLAHFSKDYDKANEALHRAAKSLQKSIATASRKAKRSDDNELLLALLMAQAIFFLGATVVENRLFEWVEDGRLPMPEGWQDSIEKEGRQDDTDDNDHV